jgi:hypothetical protein
MANALDKKFIYFPSFDAGPAGASYKKDWRFKDDTPYRFYAENFPEKYKHKYFLFPAGHNYKKMDIRKSFEFPDDMIVFGDSGGFQIATGVLKWDKNIRQNIFDWLEANSDIAMNLDIPPKFTFEGKFDECLTISADNFKFFNENQAGKTDFLNCIQGTTQQQYKTWYNKVKDFEFQGWAIGGARNIFMMMSGLAVLLDGKEHLKANNKWLHVLGVSKINDFLVLGQIQRSLNEVGSSMQMTTDSSSPSRSTVFGTWYTGWDMKSGVFRSVNVPRRDAPVDISKGNIYQHLPSMVPDIDCKIFETFPLDKAVDFETPFYAGMVLHNFAVFQEAIEQCNQLTYGDPYIMDQLISSDMAQTLKAIDELIKSDNPLATYKKYLPLFMKSAQTEKALETNISSKEFFNFQ